MSADTWKRANGWKPSLLIGQVGELKTSHRLYFEADGTGLKITVKDGSTVITNEWSNVHCDFVSGTNEKKVRGNLPLRQFVITLTETPALELGCLISASPGTPGEASPGGRPGIQPGGGPGGHETGGGSWTAEAGG